MKHPARNRAFAYLLGLVLLVALAASCAASGEPPTLADRALEHAMGGEGFWHRLWNFLGEVGLPILLGLGLYAIAGGDWFGAFLGIGGTATTARAMRPDPPPQTVTVNQTHVDSPQAGATVVVQTPNAPPPADPATLPAISEGLMRTIEHYGFWILLVYVLWLKREWWLAFLRGKIARLTDDGEELVVPVARGQAFKHALFGGRKSRERALRMR